MNTILQGALLCAAFSVLSVSCPGSVTSARAQTFMGYECTVDCSGHEAGYDWASSKGITDPYDCGGNSRSFIEGCEAYANSTGKYDAGDSEDDQEGYGLDDDTEGEE